jgi:hypothetical protein
LKDLEPLVEVFQPVLAEVCHLSLDEFACCLRQQHLVAVAGRRNACRQVHVLAEVITLGQMWRPRM